MCLVVIAQGVWAGVVVVAQWPDDNEGLGRHSRRHAVALWLRGHGGTGHCDRMVVAQRLWVCVDVVARGCWESKEDIEKRHTCFACA